MKIIQKAVLAFVITFAIMVSAQAETDLSKLTPYDGQKAINAIDVMGLEVIPRKELEEVRGEGFGNDIVGAIMAMSIAAHVSPTVLAKTFAKIFGMYTTAGKAAAAGADAFGWEIGRAMAINEGYPDPGPFYAKNNAVRYTKYMPTFVKVGNAIFQKYK